MTEDVWAAEKRLDRILHEEFDQYGPEHAALKDWDTIKKELSRLRQIIIKESARLGRALM